MSLGASSFDRLVKLFLVGSIVGLVISSHLVYAEASIGPESELRTADSILTAPDDVYQRMANHVDSWIALIIALSSLLITYTLNHVAPRIRTMGTILAALGCFAVVGWFIYVLNTGVLANPKKPIFPLDGYKPLFLWVQCTISLLSGLFLLRVAVWQNQRKDTLRLPIDNTHNLFGLVSRYLHWVTAILFISMFLMGIFASMIPEDASYRHGYYVVHKTIGSLALFLLIVRVLWHLNSAVPSLDGGLKRWERTSAVVSHFMLYFLMFALPVSGFIMSTSAGKLSHFFMWDYPLLWEKNIELTKLFALLHKLILPYLCYVVIGAHILGAVKHHFIDKRYQSIHRMVS